MNQVDTMIELLKGFTTGNDVLHGAVCLLDRLIVEERAVWEAKCKDYDSVIDCVEKLSSEYFSKDLS